MFKPVTCLLLVIAAMPLWCQPRRGFGGGGFMVWPAFQALDADRDGIISAAELAQASSSLSALDKNGDHRLTRDEVRPQMGGGRGPGGDGPGDTAASTTDDLVKTLMAFDKNGDGQLSREEMPERMQGLFDRADADRNGSLNADEIRKSAQATPSPGARGRGDGGERFGRRGREGGRGEGPDFMRMDPILAALDADADGEISAAEIAAAPAALKKLDSNADGQLSRDEVRMNGGRGPGRR